jgi:hypothetical protein
MCLRLALHHLFSSVLQASAGIDFSRGLDMFGSRYDRTHCVHHHAGHAIG